MWECYLMGHIVSLTINTHAILIMVLIAIQIMDKIVQQKMVSIMQIYHIVYLKIIKCVIVMQVNFVDPIIFLIVTYQE